VQKRILGAAVFIAIGLATIAVSFGYAFAATPDVGSQKRVSSAPPPARYALSDRVVVGVRVEERLSAGAYEYLRVRSDDGELWMVTPSISSPATSTFEAVLVARAEHFRSRITGRTFDALYFGFPLPTSIGDGQEGALE
jgi:hypothetical protein